MYKNKLESNQNYANKLLENVWTTQKQMNEENHFKDPYQGGWEKEQSQES